MNVVIKMDFKKCKNQRKEKQFKTGRISMCNSSMKKLIDILKKKLEEKMISIFFSYNYIFKRKLHKSKKTSCEKFSYF